MNGIGLLIKQTILNNLKRKRTELFWGLLSSRSEISALTIHKSLKLFFNYSFTYILLSKANFYIRTENL